MLLITKLTIRKSSFKRIFANHGLQIACPAICAFEPRNHSDCSGRTPQYHGSKQTSSAEPSRIADDRFSPRPPGAARRPRRSRAPDPRFGARPARSVSAARRDRCRTRALRTSVMIWENASPPTTATPSGRLDSAPAPVPKAIGSVPIRAAIVVIMMGRNRTLQASRIASRADFPSLRSASIAKSIIMIAFFFTRPTSMMMPTKAYTLSSMWKIHSVRSAPKPANGRPVRMVSGMDEALVENPQHDVDDQNREHEQYEQSLLGRLEGLRGTRECGGDARRKGQGSDPVHIVYRRSNRHARLQVERERDRRQLPRVIHRRRPGARRDLRERAERNEVARCRVNVKEAERIQILLVLRLELHDHPVLIVGRVDRGHLPCAVRVVERILDRYWR